MFSGIFGGKKNKTELAIVFDIGSASIGGALVNLSYGKKPLVLYTTRKDIAFASEVEPNRLLASMKRTLKETALDIQKKGLRRINFRSISGKEIQAIYCTFSAPWYLAQPKQLMNKYKETKNIDSKFVEELLRQEEVAFLEEAMKEYSKKDKEDLHLLENILTNIKIDGYDIKKLNDQKTKDLELSIFSTMIPSQVADITIDTISAIFHTKNLHMHSFALVSFGVVRDILNKNNFLLLDITGEVTEVNVIYEGKLVESGTFPFGINTFVRKLIYALNTNKEEVLSILSMRGEEAQSILVFGENEKKTLEEVEDGWCKEFVSLINDFSNSHAIPSNIVFVTDAQYTSFFKHMFTTKKHIINAISYGFIPNITVLNQNFMEPYVNIAKNTKEDPFLAIESVFFNTSHKNHDKEELATFHN